MAEVKMDLNELKAIEAKIAQLEKDNKHLKDNEKQVIVYHKYFKGTLKPSIHAKTTKVRIDGFRECYPMLSGRDAIDHFSDYVTIQSLFDRGIIEIDTTELSDRTTKDYKNMSEVIKEVRNEEISKVEGEIERLRKIASHNSEKLTIQEDKYETIIESMKNSFDKEIKLIKKKHYEEIKEKDNDITRITTEFNDFKEDKETRSLEDQVKNLKIEIEALVDKLPFWKKFKYKKNKL